MTEAAVYHAELRKICKGRGLQGADAIESCGPALTERMLSSGMTEEHIRARGRVAEWFTAWTLVLPEDLRVAVRVALGLHPKARFRFLSGRIQWLAEDMDRDGRTARRRIDEALVLLSQALAEPGHEVPIPQPPAAASADDRPGWYYAAVRALVRLDLPAPEVIEERRIVATVAGLDRFNLDVSLPSARAATGPALTAEVLYGVLLATTEHPSESHFRFEFQLPRTLAPGDQHEVSVRYTFAPGHPLPHYALIPFLRCDRFQLRVRFSGTPEPRVWLVDGAPPRTLDDSPPARATTRLDAVHEVMAEFTTLSPGLAYGFRWSAE